MENMKKITIGIIWTIFLFVISSAIMILIAFFIPNLSERIITVILSMGTTLIVKIALDGIQEKFYSKEPNLEFYLDYKRNFCFSYDDSNKMGDYSINLINVGNKTAEDITVYMYIYDLLNNNHIIEKSELSPLHNNIRIKESKQSHLLTERYEEIIFNIDKPNEVKNPLISFFH